MTISSQGSLSFVERFTPWLVLAILLALTYAFFFQAPYLGFRYSGNSEIIEVYVPRSELRAGDHVASIGSLSWEAFSADLTQGWLEEDEGPGSNVVVRFTRDAQEQEILWTLPGATTEEIYQRINSQWWFGYIFWLAGTATLFLVRPRDRRWLLLVAFNYITAVWLTAGSGSTWHVSSSALVLRSAVWLSVPVYLHLHWVFPSPLGKIPKPVLWIGYGAGLALAVVQWLQLLPSSFYLAGFLFAVVGSVVLLAFHALRKKVDRPDIRFLGSALGLVVLPPTGIALVELFGVTLIDPLRGATLLAFPAIPGAYFFILFRRQLGKRLARRADRLAVVYLFLIVVGIIFIIGIALGIQYFRLPASNYLVGGVAAIVAGMMAVNSFGPFLLLPALVGAYVPTAADERADLHFRANRLLAPFLFFVILAATLVVLIVVHIVTLQYPGAPVISGLAAALIAGVAVVVGYRPFRRLVDRHLLGVRLPPSSLPETFAARMTSCLEKEALATLLEEEVLPSLLVRQSAILLLDDPGDVEWFLAYGLHERDLPNEEATEALVARAQAGKVAPDGKGVGPDWLRLVLPLTFGERAIGLWLFGRRDPDDLYSRAELPLFRALADQMAVALTNLTQMENLRALYRENIDRHEAERARLARALHDDVLSRVAVLAVYAADEIPEASLKAFDELTARLRQTIAGLRPAMLQYGLRAALVEIGDELAERTDGDPIIEVSLAPTDARYPEPVEQHLFRIVQQAVENALKHAQAQKISVSGRLGPELVHLCVEDDGIGLPPGEATDLANLVASDHFGLAGMHERAGLIGARLDIGRGEKRGTRIEIRWESPSSDNAAM
ncbi:MAG: GAF domain-containing sensor histidine kinase [Chloroflexota bacterium]